MAWVRLGAAGFAALEVAFFSANPRPGYRPAEWSLTVAFAVGAVVLALLAFYAPVDWFAALGAAALLFDAAVVCVYAVLFAYEYGNQTRWAAILLVVEA